LKDCQKVAVLIVTHFKEFDESLLKDDYWRILQLGFLTVLRHLSEGVFLRKLLSQRPKFA
jgi:hypothetical protein